MCKNTERFIVHSALLYTPVYHLIMTLCKEEFSSTSGTTPGGTLIFSYKRRLGSFLGVQNFEFLFFWGIQKNKYFLRYEDFVDIFGGHQITGLYLGVISMHFRVFS